MSAEPCISIAMATYNGARYIREQLDSLAAQTLLPCELVVTDDGSTDATLDIVRDFAREAPFPVRVYCNENRLGFGDNFLRAASLCMGEYIAFCDQDDVWIAEKLATCAQAFTGPDVLLVMHAARVTGPDLRPTGALWPVITSDRLLSPLESSPWWSPPGFSMIYRASLLDYADANNRPDDQHAPGKTPLAHDKWLYFIAHSLGMIALLATPLVSYRQHDLNTCGASNSKNWREKMTLSIGTSERAYAHSAMLAEQRVSVLSVVESQLAPSVLQARASRAGGYWERVVRDLKCRAAFYSYRCRLASRLRLLVTLILGGAYRPPERGGFGLRGLAKDITFGLFWQHESEEGSAEEKSMGDSS
jgi:glycosyltransferase involved in cell wall biosynthesis